MNHFSKCLIYLLLFFNGFTTTVSSFSRKSTQATWSPTPFRESMEQAMVWACTAYPICSSPPSSLLSNVDKPTLWLETVICRALWNGSIFHRHLCRNNSLMHIPYSARAGWIYIVDVTNFSQIQECWKNKFSDFAEIQTWSWTIQLHFSALDRSTPNFIYLFSFTTNYIIANQPEA